MQKSSFLFCMEVYEYKNNGVTKSVTPFLYA